MPSSPDYLALPPTTREFSDEAARSALAALSGPYLPWGAGAMRPAGLVTVCNDVVINDRRRIVELGSGISTVLLARLLHQRRRDASVPPHHETRLVAVEHDDRWATWVTDQLEREDLAGYVDIIHAPLAPHPTAVGGLTWYDDAVLADGLRRALRDDPIDLFLVDGPPAYTEGHGLARYPALPVLHDRLSPGATIILDDAERPGEQEILRRWELETGLSFDRHGPRAGIALSQNGAEHASGPRHG